MPVGEAELDLVRQAVEAYNRRDLAAFANFFVAEPEIRPVRAAVDDTVFQGPDAIERFFSSSDEIWTGVHVDIEELAPAGDGVFVVGRMHARGLSSGVETAMPLAWSVTFRDGLLTALRTWTDRADALRDLGVEP